MFRIATIALLIAVFMAASGCGGGSSSGSKSNGSRPPSGNGTSVVVTPATATVYQGMTAKFQAQVVGQSNQAVTWGVQDNLGTIDSTGLYTAPRDASGGPFNVVATSQAVPSATGSAAVTVLVPQVIIAPATVTLAPGGTQTFTATVKGLANANVTWTVQEAGGGSVSNAGVYSVPASTGFFHVIATSVADATFSGSTTITVTTSTGRFTPTGNMQNARGFHSATLLANGKVLMAGGATNALDPLCLGGMASAELYDSGVGSFAPTGSMTSPRYAHTATSLLNGEVLVTGGLGSGFDCEDLGTPVLSSAELYDPSTDTFKGTGGMFAAHEDHTATLLLNGKVLVTGGNAQHGVASTTAELYDPAAGLFTRTGNMATPRSGHTATLLANGKVLIVGGFDTTNPNSQAVTAVAEIYDPITGGFTGTGSMTTARAEHTATLLIDGRVLIAGGVTNAAGGLADVSTAEVYDPTAGSFSPTGGMGEARASHTATLVPNGTVLVTGGSDSTAELYDPSTGSFRPTGGMEIGRVGHSATLLPNGKVLVAGGGSFFSLASAELYK